MERLRRRRAYLSRLDGGPLGDIGSLQSSGGFGCLSASPLGEHVTRQGPGSGASGLSSSAAATVSVADVVTTAAPTLTTLVRFTGADGYGADGGLMADAAGNLFGTTAVGGASGHGTVYEIVRTPHRLRRRADDAL